MIGALAILSFPFREPDASQQCFVSIKHLIKHIIILSSGGPPTPFPGAGPEPGILLFLIELELKSTYFGLCRPPLLFPRAGAELGMLTYVLNLN